MCVSLCVVCLSIDYVCGWCVYVYVCVSCVYVYVCVSCVFLSTLNQFKPGAYVFITCVCVCARARARVSLSLSLSLSVCLSSMCVYALAQVCERS